MKEYGTISPYRKVSITLQVGSRRIEVTFEGGHTVPIYRPAKYKTSNVVIQKMLESHPGFGREFELISVTKDEPLPVNPLITKKPVVTEDNILIDKRIEGIHNGQEARKYLNEKYNVPYSEMPNVNAIKTISSKYNITFPDWQ